MACQICLEDFSDLLTEDPGITRVQQLCGADSGCTADVCSRCLQQHIQTTLDACIRGMLPRVRCPICLSAIGKAEWIKIVLAASALAAEYELLADTTVTFTAPCCHASYTHLPRCSASVTSETRVDVTRLAQMGLPKSFQTLMDAFLRHRVDASRLILFLVDFLSTHPIKDVLDKLLDQIYDNERRAALHLSYLYRFPAVTTTCCDMRVCFNCKSTDCGDVCDSEYYEQDESLCMVRCRKCRVMLMVVEGCDSTFGHRSKRSLCLLLVYARQWQR